MKKFILSALLTVFMSSAIFANTNINVSNLEFENNKITVDLNVEYDWYWCYEIGRTEETNPMTGEVTVTITYRCVEMSQFF